MFCGESLLAWNQCGRDTEDLGSAPGREKHYGVKVEGGLRRFVQSRVVLHWPRLLGRMWVADWIARESDGGNSDHRWFLLTAFGEVVSFRLAVDGCGETSFS